ncbi:MAG: hypothetical protein M3033_05745 [Acidobacteriota bacterium]|nr:hypothetical protein [Acidobacteriota bacterium]
MATDLKLNPKETIAKAYQLLSRKESWVAEVTASHEKSPQSTLVIRVSSQNYQFINSDASGRKLMEVVCIGDDSYFFLGEKWEKEKRRDSSNLAELRESFAKSPESIKNAEFVGKEHFGGTDAAVYQFDFDFNLLKKNLSLDTSVKVPDIKMKIWISGNNLPIKIESLRETRGLKGLGIERKVEKYNFEENVKIEVPKI